MSPRYTAAMAATLLLGASSLARAQAAAPDSAHRALLEDRHALAHGQRTFSRDSTQRAELRAGIDSDYQATHAEWRQLADARKQLATDQQAMRADSVKVIADQSKIAKIERTIHRDHRDVAHDKKEVRAERREVRADRAALGKDRRELVQDRRQAAHATADSSTPRR